MYRSRNGERKKKIVYYVKISWAQDVYCWKSSFSPAALYQTGAASW